MRPHRFVTAVLLAAALAAGGAAAQTQGLEHCDAQTLMPTDISFLGPAKWATVGEYGRLNPGKIPPTHSPAAAAAPFLQAL